MYASEYAGAVRAQYCARTAPAYVFFAPVLLLLRFFCAGAAPGDGLGGSEGGEAVDAADGGGEHQTEDAEADERDA